MASDKSGLQWKTTHSAMGFDSTQVFSASDPLSTALHVHCTCIVAWYIQYFIRFSWIYTAFIIVVFILSSL